MVRAFLIIILLLVVAFNILLWYLRLRLASGIARVDEMLNADVDPEYPIITTETPKSTYHNPEVPEEEPEEGESDQEEDEEDDEDSEILEKDRTPYINYLRERQLSGRRIRRIAECVLHTSSMIPHMDLGYLFKITQNDVRCCLVYESTNIYTGSYVFIVKKAKEDKAYKAIKAFFEDESISNKRKLLIGDHSYFDNFGIDYMKMIPHKSDSVEVWIEELNRYIKWRL